MHTITTLLEGRSIEAAIEEGQQFRQKKSLTGFLISALSDHHELLRQRQAGICGSQPVHDFLESSSRKGHTSGNR